jgi:hypothetical protein
MRPQKRLIPCTFTSVLDCAVLAGQKPVANTRVRVALKPSYQPALSDTTIAHFKVNSRIISILERRLALEKESSKGARSLDGPYGDDTQFG